MADYLYAEFIDNVPNLNYEGELTTTAQVNVNEENRTIGVDVLKLPYTLTINGTSFDGSSNVNINIDSGEEESDIKNLIINNIKNIDGATSGDIISEDDLYLAEKGKLIISFRGYYYYYLNENNNQIQFRYHDIVWGSASTQKLVYKNSEDDIYINKSTREVTHTPGLPFPARSNDLISTYYFDNIPTQNSEGLLTSGAIYTALNNTQQVITIADNIEAVSYTSSSFSNMKMIMLYGYKEYISNPNKTCVVLPSFNKIPTGESNAIQFRCVALDDWEYTLRIWTDGVNTLNWRTYPDYSGSTNFIVNTILGVK